MAEEEVSITLKVDPSSAEVGGRLCLSWTGNVTERHWIGLFPSGSDDGVSSCLEKRELSAKMCEEKSMMWTLHHAVILKVQCFNLCFKLWDSFDNLVTTSETVKAIHRGGTRHSNISTSSAEDIREHGDGTEGNGEDKFKRYERIRRTLSHSRRRYSTIKRKQRAERTEALKQVKMENTIIASGNHETSSLPTNKSNDLATSLLLDRDSSAVADREMAELSGNDKNGTAEVDDSLKASKTFSSLRRANTMDLEQRRKQLNRRYVKRGTSLRYPLQEKKRIVHNLTVHASSPLATNNQLNGIDHKKPLIESVSAMTIQSEREVSVDDHSEYIPVSNNRNESPSLRQQVLTRVVNANDATPVTRTGSMEDVSRSSGGHRPSLANRSLSLPMKDEKTVTMPPESRKVKKRIDEYDEYAQLRDTPALQFLTRKDLYKFMTSAGSAAQEFFANRAMMELVQRIRKDPTLFLKYQHSRHLVAMLNTFADAKAELPGGWERKLNKEGKAFFINHHYKITSFIDPRLPVSSDNTLEQALLQQQQRRYTEGQDSMGMKTLPRNQHPQTLRRNEAELDDSDNDDDDDTEATPSSSTAPSPQQPQLAYNELVVNFLRRPDIFDIIPRRFHQPITPDLRALIETIQMTGTSAMDELASRPRMLDLAIILSLFDREINDPNLLSTPRQHTVTPLSTARRAFEEKLTAFRNQLDMLGFAQSARIKFYIRRDHLLEDSFEQVIGSRIRYLQRRKLDVVFVGEEGLDYGGPSREYFFLLSHELFNPYYGLFEYSAANTYTAQVSATSSFIENNLEWFKFAGRLIGHAIAQGYLLDVFFTRPFYKALLNQQPSLKDLESVEPEFHSSLQWILDNDPEPLDLTFVVEEEAFGELVEKELKPGGLDVPVIEDNKQEYIDLMVKWRMDRGVSQQMECLVKGFREIIPLSLVKQFDAQELEFVIAGTVEIDVRDWRIHTEYRNGYHGEHPTIKLFWDVIENFSNEQRLRLLQFVTGTSSMPFEGFKALKGSNGPKLFTIDNVGEPESLPRSHTCFNRLDLPPYTGYDQMYEKLVYAVEEGGSFGIE